MISADRIKNWAKADSAKHDIGWLLRRLIKATCPNWSRVDMQDGSQMYLGGYDGIVDCEGYKCFAPSGHSVWEASTRLDIGRKANQDYAERTEDPDGEDKSHTGFVFATPRGWNGHDDWAQERTKEREWQTVTALDASSLANWLEDAPGIACDFARRCLGIRLPDLRTGEEIWESYSAGAFSPDGNQIGARFVIAGRDNQCRQLMNWLSVDSRSSGSLLAVYGASTVEIVHFVCAAAYLAGSLGGQEADVMTALVWAKSEEALSYLSTVGPGHVILAAAPLTLDVAKLANRPGCSAIVMHECTEAPRLDVWGEGGHPLPSIYIEPAEEPQWVDELCQLGMLPEDALRACREAGLDYARFCQLAPAFGLFGLGRDCQ